MAALAPRGLGRSNAGFTGGVRVHQRLLRRDGHPLFGWAGRFFC